MQTAYSKAYSVSTT